MKYRPQQPTIGFIRQLLLIGGILLLGRVDAQSEGATMTLYKDGTALIKQPVEWVVQTGITRVEYAVLPTGLFEDSPFLTIEGARVGYQRMNRDVFTWEKYFTDRVGSEVELQTLDGKEEEGVLVEFSPARLVLQQRSYVKMFARNQVKWITVVGKVDSPRYEPYLSWDLYSRNDRTVHGDLIYLARGFDWDAVYRLILDTDTSQGELITEAFISNRDELDFSDLELQLVEGNLNRAGQPRPLSRRSADVMMMEMASSAPAVPTAASLGDYHIYSLPERISLSGQESVTVRLYNPSRINYIKTYVFRNSERGQSEEPLLAEYKFANNDENQLNKPLPQGKIEIYQMTARGSIEFIGEDNIRQVPKGEWVTITAGRSFDVIGKRKVLNYDRQKKSEEAAIELMVINTRAEAVAVRLEETINGDWVIRNESTMYLKVDASTIHFPLSVPAEDTVRVTYTFRKAWN